MQVVIEEISGSGFVTGRIVLTGNRDALVVAQLSLTRADWEDFMRCLGHTGDTYPRRIVLEPAKKEPAPSAKCKRAAAPISRQVQTAQRCEAITS